MGIVYRLIATCLIKKTGHAHTTACTGVVILIQRFGNSLNLNIHYHNLFLDGVYIEGDNVTKIGQVPAFLNKQAFPDAKKCGQTISVVSSML
jgi:hypothetical protein